MLQLRVFGRQTVPAELGRNLDQNGTVQARALTAAIRPEHALLTGAVPHYDADEVPQFLTAHGVTLIWADMIGQTRSARPDDLAPKSSQSRRTRS